MYLYGASGHAKVIKDIIEACGQSVDAFFDDNPSVTNILDVPVLHGYGGECPLIVSIGSNAIRKRIAERIGRGAFSVDVHPSAVVSPSASISEGTVVMQGAVIQAGASVGRHCIVNTGASIDHECVLGDYVHVSPHGTLCGNVSVGEGTWIGAGATVIQGVKIGRWCIIGAGSVVTKDIPDGSLAVGNRCRIIKKINQEYI